LLFHWVELERQVRIEGLIARVPAEESDAYYAVRPLGSRVGAWASPQSEEIPDRAWLEQREADARRSLGEEPARPPFWGGYRLEADRLEFWQGRPSRLHDRLLFSRGTDGWTIARLAP